MESETRILPDEDANLTVNDESKTLLQTCKVYKTRFYILLVFSYFALLQIAVWNTWGPVSNTTRKVYGWDNTNLALLPIWVTLLLLVFFIPMGNIIHSYGLRFATLHCAFLTAVATGIRCIPGSDLLKTIEAHVCAFIAGYTGTLGMVAPTTVSAVWFPPNERTKSTAFITTAANNVAMGLSFLIPKLMVHDYNITRTDVNDTQPSEKRYEMRVDLNNLMYLHFALCLAAFVIILVYFPKSPPSPSSPSSMILERVDFRRSLPILVRSRNFMSVLIAFGLPVGFQYSFISVFDETLLPIGISQDTSNWIGLYGALSGIPASFLFSTLIDYNKKLMKPLLILCMFGAGIAYTCFAFIGFGVIPGNIVLVYIFVILGAFFSNATIPLAYEFACEISYPVSEEVINGLLAAANCLFGSVLLGLVMIKSVGTSWVPGGMAGSFVFMTPLMLTVRAEYRRLQIDSIKTEADSQDNLLRTVCH